MILNTVPKISPWLAGLCMLVFLLSWSFEPQAFYLHTHMYMDDSFFYYTVARNIAAGLGSTFDGINVTNGYQPLWQMICTALAFITAKHEPFLHMVNVLQAVCAGCVVFFVSYHWVRTCSLSPLSLLPLGFLFIYNSLWGQFTNGLETGLAMALVSAIGVLLSRSDYSNDMSLALLGILAGLSFLARTDGIFLVVSIFILITIRYSSSKKEFLRALLLFGAPASFLIGPYLASNILVFHTFMPISGTVKQTWAQLTVVAEAPHGLSLFQRKMQLLLWPLDHPDYYPIGIAVSLNVAYLILTCIFRLWGSFTLAFFSILKYFAYVLIFHNYSRFQWYYGSDYVIALILTASVLRHVLQKFCSPKNQQIFVGSVSSILFILILYSGWATHSPYSAIVNLNHHKNIFENKSPPGNELSLAYAATSLLNRMPLPPRIVFSSHNSGAFAYFLDRRVVNMDGLINGLSRLEYIKKYGWDFLHYLDSQEYIGAYIDCVPDPAYPDYHRSFVEERGFVEFDIRKVVSERFGYSPTNSLVLFLKPQMVDAISKDRKFAKYLLQKDEKRSPIG